MNQGLSLSRPLCARNAGVFTIARVLIGSLIFFALNTIYYVPREAMLIAAQSVKANVLLFIAMICALFFMSLFSLVVAFPLNNVFTRVNKDLSKAAARLRLIEVLIFIISMVLLFAEISFFNEVLLFGLIFYALNLICLGYLVFKSGYLSRVLGIFLIIGGSIGYLFESLAHFFLPSFVWFSPYGVLVAIIAEITFAIILVMKAMQKIAEPSDPRETIINILEDLGEATTTEIIDESSKVSSECKDRIPNTLIALEKDKEVTKRFSKEKRGYVWTLVS